MDRARVRRRLRAPPALGHGRAHPRAPATGRGSTRRSSPTGWPPSSPTPRRRDDERGAGRTAGAGGRVPGPVDPVAAAGADAGRRRPGRRLRGRLAAQRRPRRPPVPGAAVSQPRIRAVGQRLVRRPRHPRLQRSVPGRLGSADAPARRRAGERRHRSGVRDPGRAPLRAARVAGGGPVRRRHRHRPVHRTAGAGVRGAARARCHRSSRPPPDRPGRPARRAGGAVQPGGRPVRRAGRRRLRAGRAHRRAPRPRGPTGGLGRAGGPGADRRAGGRPSRRAGPSRSAWPLSCRSSSSPARPLLLLRAAAPRLRAGIAVYASFALACYLVPLRSAATSPGWGHCWPRRWRRWSGGGDGRRCWRSPILPLLYVGWQAPVRDVATTAGDPSVGAALLPAAAGLSARGSRGCSARDPVDALALGGLLGGAVPTSSPAAGSDSSTSATTRSSTEAGSPPPPTPPGCTATRSGSSPSRTQRWTTRPGLRPR